MDSRKVTFQVPTQPLFKPSVPIKNAMFPSPQTLARSRSSIIPRGGDSLSQPIVGEYVVQSIDQPDVIFEEDMTPANINLKIGELVSVKGSRYKVVDKRLIVYGYACAIKKGSGENTIIPLTFPVYVHVRINTYIRWNQGVYLVLEKRLAE